MWKFCKFFLLLFGVANALFITEENIEIQEIYENERQKILPKVVNSKSVIQSPISTTTPQTFKSETPEYLKYCFHAEAELCRLHSNENRNHTQNTTSSPIVTSNLDINSCQCHPHPNDANSWYCCNITHMSMVSTCSNLSSWINLHIINLSIPALNFSSPIYQKLHSLVITDGNIRVVNGVFSRVSSIKCLNISNNNLTDMEPRSISSLQNLMFLGIANNNLSRIPKWRNKNITADIRGNKHMLCESLIDAVFRNSFKFVDPESSFCLQNHTYSWFNSTVYVAIQELDTARRFRTECPEIPNHGKCECAPEQMLITGDQSKPSAKLFCRVNCANLSLKELPPKLPENTFSLDVSQNNITSIGKHFHSNPTYQNIVKLYADDNKISSMHELEGTKFMDNFQRLSLRNNALSRIPDYLLTNVLDSIVGRNIFLGGNKLQCDCNSAKVLKLWLLERSRDIPDYNEIMCRNFQMSVMELQEIKVCQSPHDWTDYIYYLIATEVILLLALITKVSYDYWIFKTAGYLPWPANKMPKLPCDCLCES